MNNKKQYQQPTMVATLMEPRTVLCASSIVDSDAGEGMWGA